MASDAQKQIYDNVLKRLVQHQASAIIPLLLGESDCYVLGEENIEVLLPPRRTDRVYALSYHRQRVIVDIECESSGSSIMAVRLLIYHAILLEKYKCPVISVIVYPFEVDMASSPFQEILGDEEILTFRYRTVPLFLLDARTFVKRKAIQIYGMLPAMQGVSDELLLQAIDEMVQFYQENETLLRDELLCFRVLLARAQRLPEAAMLRVERRIRMFDPLLEEDPWVKEKLAEREKRGLVEGEKRGLVEGELNNARSTLVRFIQRRFPSLTEIAQTKTAQLCQVDTLNTLIEQLWFAPDEKAAHALLEAV